jgi:hypothetical protein
MLFRAFFAASALFSLVLAQSTELQLEGIKAHFQNAELVPVPVPVFEPTAILTATFQGLGAISPGQVIPETRQDL